MSSVTTDPNIHTQLDTEGVLLARIDMPGRAMNVFSASMMDSLEALLARVEADAAIRGVVLTSSKTAFVAGADLEMIRMFAERARSAPVEELNALFGRLGRLFRKIELCRKPWVAAINGLGLGGGLEVCLACHARISIDDEKTVRLGLPEIKLGLLPGAGGTQRLPRLVGTQKGLEMLLTGEPVGPAEARSLGLVDAIVPADSLITEATALVKTMDAPRAPWDRPGVSFPATPFDFTRPTAADEIAAAIGISDYQLRRYPAYRAIIDCVVGGWDLEFTPACEREMDIFVELMRDPVAGNMVRTLFLNRQKATKLGLLAPDSVLSRGDDALLPMLRAANAQSDASGATEAQKLVAATLAALRCWHAGHVDSPELADVAAVVAGLFPSYAGGPFTHARHLGASALTEHAARMGDEAVAAAIDSFFADTARQAVAA